MRAAALLWCCCVPATGLIAGRRPSPRRAVRRAAAAERLTFTFADVNPRAPTGLVALSERMLAFDPKQRATMARSLADPCFDDYREDDLEARAGYRVEMDDVEAVAIDASAIRALLWKDIRSFHRDSDPLGDRGGSPDSSHDGATDDGAFDAETPNALGGFSAALTMITPPDTTHLKHRAGAPK